MENKLSQLKNSINPGLAQSGFEQLGLYQQMDTGLQPTPLGEGAWDAGIKNAPLKFTFEKFTTHPAFSKFGTI